jgi:hypothetical protein
MKKNNKGSSPNNKEPLKQGRANSNFPQEYEEQLSTDIRMKPQPLEAWKKTAAEKLRIGIAADYGGFKSKESGKNAVGSQL